LFIPNQKNSYFEYWVTSYGFGPTHSCGVARIFAFLFQN
jgi:hypothetical protein